MMAVIFAVGAFVFFLTIYGTVVAGGLRLTKDQLQTSPELRSGMAATTGGGNEELPTRKIVGSKF